MKGLSLARRVKNMPGLSGRSFMKLLLCFIKVCIIYLSSVVSSSFLFISVYIYSTYSKKMNPRRNLKLPENLKELIQVS